MPSRYFGFGNLSVTVTTPLLALDLNGRDARSTRNFGIFFIGKLLTTNHQPPTTNHSPLTTHHSPLTLSAI
ncbi:hypothetical protein [Scytonema sp. NUACC21]